MKRFFIPMAILAMGTTQTLFANPLQEEWVVQDMLLAETSTSTDVFGWSSGLPLGDTNSDGKNTHILFGFHLGPTLHTLTQRVSTGTGGTAIEFQAPTNGVSGVTSIWWDPGIALLKTPHGVEALIRNGSFLEFRAFPGGTLLSTLTIPPPNPGELAQINWDAIWNAGDLDSDGYDDVFCLADAQGIAASYALSIHGASRSVSWRRYLLDSNYLAPITPSPKSGYPDLNGDGVPDLPAGFVHSPPPYLAPNRQVIALSGVDGTTIWNSVTTPGWFDPGIVGPDLNGDSRPEIFSTGIWDRVYCLDGASGSTTWTLPVATVLPLLPSGSSHAFFDNPLFFRGNDEGELLARIRYSIPGTGTLQFAMARIDPTTGLLLGVAHAPPTLSPWTTDDFVVNNLQVCLLGDIDRDGYNEIGVQVYTPSTDPGGFWPSSATGTAILAPPTLEVPSTLSLGNPSAATIDLPSAGGMLLQLVCSTEFEGSGGLQVDRWPSYLLPSRILDWSRTQPLLTTLDAQGAGSIQVPLPNQAALIGLDLYFKGIAWDPNAPFSEVWTTTTMAQATTIP